MHRIIWASFMSPHQVYTMIHKRVTIIMRSVPIHLINTSIGSQYERYFFLIVPLWLSVTYINYRNMACITMVTMDAIIRITTPKKNSNFIHKYAYKAPLIRHR